MIETTQLDFAEIAFASGFGSIRQFNDTVRTVFATSPSDLRKRSSSQAMSPTGSIVLRLARRDPFDGSSLLAFLIRRAIPGIEEGNGTIYRRTLALPHGGGVAELKMEAGFVSCNLQLEDVRDLGAAVGRCRSLLDLDSDPQAVYESLRSDAALRAVVRAKPGCRVPGAVDGFEVACRTVLGQQISIGAARTLGSRVAETYGKPLTSPSGTLQRTFPTAETLAEADLEGLGIPSSRSKTLTALAKAVASGDVRLDPGADRDEAEQQLLELKGIGPWTASYVRMRALRDPDVFLPTDLGVRRALEQLHLEGDPAHIATRWRPWRSYALQYLWTTV